MNGRARPARHALLFTCGAALLSGVAPTRGDEPALEVIRVLTEGRVVVRLEGHELAVRLIGVACDGPTAALEDLLRGPAEVTFEPGQVVEADGTPLVELVRDGRSLNEEVVRLGLGHADVTAPPVRRSRLRAIEDGARRGGRGLWTRPAPVSEVVPMSAPPDRATEPTEPVAPPITATAEIGPPPPATAEPADAVGPIRWIERQAGAWSRTWPSGSWDVASRAAFGLLGMWVARQRRRRLREGLALGLLFGPFGVLIGALMPVVPVPFGGSDGEGVAAFSTPRNASVLWSGDSEELAIRAAWLSDDDRPCPLGGSESTESASAPIRPGPLGAVNDRPEPPTPAPAWPAARSGS